MGPAPMQIITGIIAQCSNMLIIIRYCKERVEVLAICIKANLIVLLDSAFIEAITCTDLRKKGRNFNLLATTFIGNAIVEYFWKNPRIDL
ncbi:hypothetical protein D3C81_1936500 [compost metagenome]